jgi:putative transposase
MVDRGHGLPVAAQVKLLGISRGTAYYVGREPGEGRLKLMRALDELHLKYPFMGQRQLAGELVKMGFKVGRRQVRTLMVRMGIRALVPQPGTSQKRPGHKVYPYLLGGMKVERANQVWALDTTYIPMAKGFVYLTAVVDVFSRYVLAYRVATTLEACHAVEAVKQALAKYGCPEIVNTDQGSQFTAVEFTQVVLGAGARLSMDGKGAWRDNVFVERLWRTVKYEHVYLHAYADVAEARAKVGLYLAWYNTGRRHSSLGGLAPQAAYWAARPQLALAA